MPNKDKTGPTGKGAKTGRQRGDCEEAQATAKGGCGKGRGNCGCGGRGRPGA